MPCCCMNDFASLSADFTIPHFSADLTVNETIGFIMVNSKNKWTLSPLGFDPPDKSG